jgi:hypothetical protein
MSTVTINGTAFSGLPNGTGNQSAWQPTKYQITEQKIGVTLIAANGTRNRVERGVNKRVLTIGWEKTNQATMQALRTIQRLNTTFTVADFEGNSITVQTEDDEFAPSWNFNNRAGTPYWDVEVVYYEP